MPRISWRGDVTLTLTLDVEARIEFGDPGGTYAVEEFKITGVDGIEAQTYIDNGFPPEAAKRARLSFDNKFQDLVRKEVEDELVLEAKR